MKNPKITNEELQNLVDAYKDGKIGKKLMLKALYNLAERVYDSAAYFKVPNKEEVLEDTSQLCLDKLAKFDKTRGKAWNFLTTIIMCNLRQMTKTQFNKNTYQFKKLSIPKENK